MRSTYCRTECTVIDWGYGLSAEVASVSERSTAEHENACSLDRLRSCIFQPIQFAALFIGGSVFTMIIGEIAIRPFYFNISLAEQLHAKLRTVHECAIPYVGAEGTWIRQAYIYIVEPIWNELCSTVLT